MIPTFRPMLLAPLLSILFTIPVAADDSSSNPANGVRTIHLTSGTVIAGRVLEVTDTNIVFEFADLPGSKGSVARSAIVPSDVFDLLLEARDPKTADAWLGLAKEAGTLGLHNDRMWSLRNAAKLDPQRAADIEKEIEVCREACSTERMGVAKSFLDAGELERARRYLQTVLTEYRGCGLEAEAKELLKTIAEENTREKTRAAATLVDRRKIQDSQEDLQAVRDLMERAGNALREGRQSLERPGVAITRFNEAHALFERAWKLLAGFTPPASVASIDREGLSKETGRLKEVLRDDMVGVHLELGHAYLTRSNYNRATAHAGEAAALDPENPGVLALRIAIASGRSRGGVR